MKYFEDSEFRCRCGCGQGINKMHPDMLVALDNAREYAGVPFKLNSAYRCLTYNTTIGGKPKSAHTRGYAVDIATTNSRNRFKILAGLIAEGFDRIGIDGNFIHADMDPDKDWEVAWLY